MKFDAKVRALLGREPTREELARLKRIGDTLKIEDNDAIYSVLVAFESYQGLYSEIPKQIEAAAHSAREIAGKAARDAIDASVGKTKEELAASVARTKEELAASGAKAKAELAAAIAMAVQSAAKTTGALRLRWMVQGFAAALAAVVLLGGAAWVGGKDAGRAEALGEAHEAAVWAETPEGQAARLLSDSGELGALLRCDRPGWRVEKLSKGQLVKGGPTKRCIPEADKKGLYGWVLFEQ